MIKKNWSLYLLIAAAIICSISFIANKKSSNNKVLLSANAFAINNGWGYNIVTNNTVYIHQQYIPAIEGNKSFVTKAEALAVAALVINKLKSSKAPTVSLNELAALQITY